MTDETKKKDDEGLISGVPLSAFEEALKAVESIQQSSREKKAKPKVKREVEAEVEIETRGAGDLDDLLKYLGGAGGAQPGAKPAKGGREHPEIPAGPVSKTTEDLDALAELLRQEQDLEKEAEFLRTVLMDKAQKGEAVDPKAVEEKQTKIDELHERLLRIQAEFNNFKKRIERDKAEIVRFSNENLLLALLPIIDNVERAMAHARATQDTEAVIDGLDLILRQLFDTLAAKGLRRLEAESEVFDPAFHDAMATFETDEMEPGRVLSQYERGYLLHGRLLRPARVVVAVKPATRRAANDQQPSEGAGS
ncbi:MAG: nucleotide exchange factor GrpE [Deltaproteobacteria bacterium]|nr:nucleotide exchange factor GrpE [Deltaproteobacteria bacterium]